MRDKSWFELRDAIKATPESQVWTPLWERKETVHTGQFGYEGYVSETTLTVCMGFPKDSKSECLKINWESANPGFGHGPYPERGNYVPTGIDKNNCVEAVDGVFFVLEKTTLLGLYVSVLQKEFL